MRRGVALASCAQAKDVLTQPGAMNNAVRVGRFWEPFLDGQVAAAGAVH